MRFSLGLPDRLERVEGDARSVVERVATPGSATHSSRPS